MISPKPTIRGKIKIKHDCRMIFFPHKMNLFLVHHLKEILLCVIKQVYKSRCVPEGQH